MTANYDAQEIEPKMQKFWVRQDIYEKAREKNRGKKPYYFLDGPPYTSGTVHIGTAWNKALKDIILRYKRMQGFDVWDRAGYDMHGLPTENKVREKFRIGLKKEIEEFGIDRFNDACEQFAVDMMHRMSHDFERLGIWMDFENAYTSITRQFIDGEWLLIKKAHEKKRLYEGLRTMHWCAKCQTNLAKHDLEYASVNEDSIFVKLKIIGKENEYLIIWTTTPWTIPFNLAVMANPELDYVKVKVKDEVWVIAKPLANLIVQGIVNETPELIEEFRGKKLEGLEYEHPFADVLPQYAEIKKKAPKTHTVLMSSEYVDASAGSGLVHCAPGCGPEDYEVGHANNIPPWNTLDESGTFPEEMGGFAGLKAKKDDKKFTEELKKRGALVAVTKVEHDYAHCQRCHSPVIFRTTKQWFFRVEDLKEKMIEANNKIYWVPNAAYNAFNSWLVNLRDNSITRQNFWGTPIPIWKCECGKYDVLESIAELEKRSGKKVEKLHRPWIDEFEIPCKCGKKMRRITDVLDVWVDAGTVSWNCLYYPHKKEIFEKLFPADFILEGKDQIRGWFNLLMIASFIAFGRPSYKSVYMHGFVQDALGRKMSKSVGNYIEPKEVVDRFGADTFRFYTIGGANPGIDLNYNHEDAKLKHKNIIILWNLHNYLIELSQQLGLNPEKLDAATIGKLLCIEEKYIISKLHSAIKKVTVHFEKYEINEVPGLIENLWLELSRTYVQMVREKASVGTENEKQAVLYTIYSVMKELAKIFAPVCPFVCEQIYLNFREKFGLGEESVHLLEWPKADEAKINLELEQAMDTASQIVAAVLSAREKAKINLRWPLKAVEVVSKNEDVRKAVEKLEDLIKVQANVKQVNYHAELPEIKTRIQADAGAVGKQFGNLAPQIIAKLNEAGTKNVIESLEKTGKFAVRVQDAAIELTGEHIKVKREVPERLVEGEFRNGFVYIDTTRTKKLDAEGYARELMRRVQALRKKAGLQKQDRIRLLIHCDRQFAEMMKDWQGQIKEKVGAWEIAFSSEKPEKRFQHSSEEKVRKFEFGVYFDKT